MKKKFVSILIAILCVACFIGCSSTGKQLDKAALVTDISTLAVPEGVKIVGLGEAAHGSSELQQLKGDVFRSLVKNNGCRVFAIEGDFGGCAKVNEYIHGGSGTAKKAVSEIGFAIYRTQEMADLVQWMHDYNKTAGKGEDLKFYGFDMQRYDNNKELLFRYLNKAAPELSTKYQKKFAPLTNDAMYSLSNDVLKQAKNDVSSLIKEMNAQKSTLSTDSKRADFDFALECAQCILENTELRQESTEYNKVRDAAMTEKVKWIVKRESGILFINGHNGHIGKESVAGYTCMGKQLSDAYGDAYFAIGTDVKNTQFNASSGDSYQVFSVKNQNDLTAQLNSVDGNLYYLDFSHVAQDADWQQTLNTAQRMTALNVSFSSTQKFLKESYTLSVTPAKDYNGVIVLKTTTPTHMFE